MEFLIITAWIACAFINYGFWVDHFQSAYPDLAEDDWLTDRVFGGILSLIGGPIGLFVSLLMFWPVRWRM